MKPQMFSTSENQSRSRNYLGLLFLMVIFQTSISTAIIGGQKVPAGHPVLTSVFGISALNKTAIVGTYDGQKSVAVSEEEALSNVAAAGMNCTATAIGKRVLVTAAHCIPDLNKNYLFVIPSFEINQQTNSQAMHPIRSISVIVHEKYSHAQAKEWYDIGLIFVQENLPTNINSMTLGNSDQDFSNAKIYAAGFGVTQLTELVFGKSLTFGNVLMDNLSFSPIEAEFGSNGVTTCYADSGGPIYKAGADGTFQILGIVSRAKDFAVGCDVPTILTRIDRLKAWIMSQTN